MFWTRKPEEAPARASARVTHQAETKAATAINRPPKPLFSVYTPGTPVWSDDGYATLARQSYCRNPVAYRAVRMIADAAASAPISLKNADYQFRDHWLLKLLDHPGPHMSRTSLIETLAAHLLLEGNAYLLGAFVDGSPKELYLLRPDRVRVVAGKDGWAKGYQYTAGQTTVSFERDGSCGLMPVAHMRLFHPLDDHYGMGALQPARAALDLHQGSSHWNKALLDNAARPSGALVYKGGDGHLDGEAFERLKAELQNTYQGDLNAGRPMLLEGGLDWRPMSMKPKDMDFQEARHGAMREIALAFGVPPLLLGLPGDNTYANYAEAQRALWRQTVLPLLGRILDGITHWLSPLSPEERLTLSVDLDAIEALAPEREALWKRVAAADFLADDEKRQMVGFGAKPSDQKQDHAQGSDDHDVTNPDAS